MSPTSITSDAATNTDLVTPIDHKVPARIALSIPPILEQDTIPTIDSLKSPARLDHIEVLNKELGKVRRELDAAHKDAVSNSETVRKHEVELARLSDQTHTFENLQRECDEARKQAEINCDMTRQREIELLTYSDQTHALENIQRELDAAHEESKHNLDMARNGKAELNQVLEQTQKLKESIKHLEQECAKYKGETDHIKSASADQIAQLQHNHELAIQNVKKQLEAAFAKRSGDSTEKITGLETEFSGLRISLERAKKVPVIMETSLQRLKKEKQDLTNQLEKALDKIEEFDIREATQTAITAPHSLHSEFGSRVEKEATQTEARQDKAPVAAEPMIGAEAKETKDNAGAIDTDPQNESKESRDVMTLMCEDCKYLSTVAPGIWEDGKVQPIWSESPHKTSGRCAEIQTQMGTMQTVEEKDTGAPRDKNKERTGGTHAPQPTVQTRTSNTLPCTFHGSDSNPPSNASIKPESKYICPHCGSHDARHNRGLCKKNHDKAKRFDGKTSDPAAASFAGSQSFKTSHDSHMESRDVRPNLDATAFVPDRDWQRCGEYKAPIATQRIVTSASVLTPQRSTEQLAPSNERNRAPQRGQPIYGSRAAGGASAAGNSNTTVFKGLGSSRFASGPEARKQMEKSKEEEQL